MKKVFSYFFSICIILPLVLQPIPVSAQYINTYKHYVSLGKQAFEAQDFDAALEYFKYANLVHPEDSEAIKYIQLIKNTGVKIEKKKFVKFSIEVKNNQSNFITKFFNKLKNETKENYSDNISTSNLQKTSKPPKPKILDEENHEVLIPKRLKKVLQERNTVYLDDSLWQRQPGTSLQVEINSVLILEGKNIQRHLIITPGFIVIEAEGRDRIKLIAKNRGKTFLHLWDDRGRWTFNVEVIFPIQTELIQKKEDLWVQGAKPFEITYSTDWNSFYTGENFDKLQRKNLGLIQRLGISGETPYGNVDASGVFNKLNKTTEATSYTVGLEDGQMGILKNFDIRGFDIVKEFSPLTLPGQYIRGIFFEGHLFEDKLQYSYLRGRDRITFGVLSPGIANTRNSFLEGAKLTLFPEKESYYSLNFARGYGSERREFLKDRVFSIEGQQRIKNVLLYGEVAYDEQEMAQMASFFWEKDFQNLRINFRDIEKNFATIASQPGNRGEVGANIFYNLNLENMIFSSNLELYRDRFLFNPEDKNAVNISMNASLDIPLNLTDRWNASFYYLDTLQEISPQNNFRINTNYSKRFPLWKGKNLTAHLGGSYQQSRFTLSPSSEYDRFSLSTGMSFPVIRNLNYYLNYQYSWVDETLSGERLKPSVMMSGFNYTKKMNDLLSGNMTLAYRNEENTEGNNSFLAGEDNITGSVGLNYRPTPDVELFMDGRIRNVWAENSNADAFNEVDVRGGVRTAWETPFLWNPQGTIKGYVFKDFNGNQKKDYNEEGISDVRVQVGRTEVTTDRDGYYLSKVRGKKVRVSVDIDTIPDGFIFSTPIFREVKVSTYKMEEINFGLKSQSGIYGIIFYDVNKNGKPDSGDIFIPKVRIILDKKEKVVSDFEGTYFLKDVSPGKHTLQIDINSLPIEYIPKIKIKNEIVIAEGATYIFHIPLVRTKN
ncbi:hypothetical protein MNBD_UNCLBAC01-331 [hydrothermal vent metagenome]|uniref:Uncharacterized protein n=1 Tax=hydrothermal vent metagenome TaxID=652676 RepID=A0A3B1DAE9_9ZZZZ